MTISKCPACVLYVVHENKWDCSLELVLCMTRTWCVSASTSWYHNSLQGARSQQGCADCKVACTHVDSFHSWFSMSLGSVIAWSARSSADLSIFRKSALATSAHMCSTPNRLYRPCRAPKQMLIHQCTHYFTVMVYTCAVKMIHLLATLIATWLCVTH